MAIDPFFSDYREQSRIKHRILVKYLLAYFNVFKGRQENLNYFDCFAGIGAMPDGTPLSPIRTLSLIASREDLAEKVNTIFIEKKEEHFALLESCVREFFGEHQHIREPECYLTTFEEYLASLMIELRSEGKTLAPSFFFVDPTDVKGIPMSSLRDALLNNRAEVFVFFNYDGANRVLGLPKSQTAIELFGSEERVSELKRELQGKSPKVREILVRDSYFEGLREEGGASYILPFKIEKVDQKRTSHYLIRVCKQSGDQYQAAFW